MEWNLRLELITQEVILDSLGLIPVDEVRALPDLPFLL